MVNESSILREQVVTDTNYLSLYKGRKITMKIKRILSLVLAAAMMAVVFVGCSKSEDKTSSTSGAAKTVEIGRAHV